MKKLILIFITISTSYGDDNLNYTAQPIKTRGPVTMSRDNFQIENRNQQIRKECGFRNVDGAGSDPMSYFEEEAEYGEFPWMIAVLREKIVENNINILYQCGGSLISSNVVLTAAHCVIGKSSNSYRVRAGEWNTRVTDEPYPHTERSVIDIIAHEQYNKDNLHNDIALLILNSSIPNNFHINTICLPSQNQNYLDKNCITTGWGKDSFGGTGTYQTILKKIELPTISFNDCQELLRKGKLGKRFILDDSFMCAGGEQGIDACKGDGGGPLVCPIDGNPGYYYQAGIVSWGIKCGDNQVPGVYVDVGKYRKWIDDKLNAWKSQNSG